MGHISSHEKCTLFFNKYNTIYIFLYLRVCFIVIAITNGNISGIIFLNYEYAYQIKQYISLIQNLFIGGASINR